MRTLVRTAALQRLVGESAVDDPSVSTSPGTAVLQCATHLLWFRSHGGQDSASTLAELRVLEYAIDSLSHFAVAKSRVPNSAIKPGAASVAYMVRHGVLPASQAVLSRLLQLFGQLSPETAASGKSVTTEGILLPSYA